MRGPKPLLRVHLEYDDDRLRIYSVERVDGLIELTRQSCLDTPSWAYEYFQDCTDQVVALVEEALEKEPMPGVREDEIGSVIVTGRMWTSYDPHCGEADAGFDVEDVEALLTRVQVQDQTAEAVEHLKKIVAARQ